MTKPKIFISHSWEDKALAKRIETDLKLADAEVWIDHSETRGGDNLPKRISEALESCDTFILIWSEAAESSSWVELEWTNAIALRKKIIPCLLSNNKLPAILANQLYIDFQVYELGLTQLLRALRLRDFEKSKTEFSFKTEILIPDDTSTSVRNSTTPFSTLFTDDTGGVLTPYINQECNKLKNYLNLGGYEAAKKALNMPGEQVIDEVTKSNLRGLGGAGFPAGRKWGFIPKDSPKPKYLVINADESEPGTCKDKYIILGAAHALLEGMIIAARAINAHTCYIYIRGEYVEPAQIMQAAIDEAYEAKILGKKILGTDYALDVYIHRGGGAYICGEETALLESLEGKKGWPRMKPPFPAIEGLFRSPTIVNNVETIAYVPMIMNKGWEWFAKLGTERNGGYRFYSISGHVNRPGVYELPVGTTLRTMLYDYAGGIRGGKKLKLVVPGGSSSPPLRPEEIDVKMDFDSLAAIGSMLGSAGIIAMDEDTCLLDMLMVTTRFYHHESCGQCTPCREGTGWMDKILNRMLRDGGRIQDVNNMPDIANGIMGNTICPLGDAAALPVLGYFKKFREEFESHAKTGKCHKGEFTSWKPAVKA